MASSIRHVTSGFRSEASQRWVAATPRSAQYGQYLSKSQVNHYASPSEEAVASVLSWLESQGLTFSSLSPAGDWISVKATVGQANRLFQAEFKRYKAEGLADPVIRTLSYVIPEMVKDHIASVHLTTVFLEIGNQRTQVAKNVTLARSSDDDDSAHLFQRDEPNNIPPSCIAGPEDDPAARDKPYSLPCRFDLYGVPHSTVGSPVKENSLWMSGYNDEFANRNMAKNYLQSWRPDLVGREMFGLVTVTGGLNNQLPLGAAVFPVRSPPNVLVGDWPIAEFRVDAAPARSLCNSYAQLAARGVTIVFPVMPDGVGLSKQADTSCPKFYVPFPASCPYVTAVGASSVSKDGTFEQISSSNTGGFSTHFPRPVYQDIEYLQALEDGVYEGMYDPSGRAIPDVSPHQYWTMGSGEPFAFGSESFSTYFFGGIVALLNEELISAGRPTLDFLNTLIYQNLDAFNDFTTGNNPGCETRVSMQPSAGIL
ncbi:Pro-kumamolisin, activation domain-containing protein [Pterulicium gracile]|uniref:Pro-kumamolisin, activation domain-containing protein n=1 Tax=Pterulicium gracile TaxID=1884261 RepID=A0A5C3QLU7_9AGAR|nr:Pro-kumamolisin, activation domain-containing protein [Pterula gracilis]